MKKLIEDIKNFRSEISELIEDITDEYFIWVLCELIKDYIESHHDNYGDDILLELIKIIQSRFE